MDRLTDQLKDLTLKEVVPLNKKLGRGAYGSVFTVKYRGVVCAAKKIHSILCDGDVSPVDVSKTTYSSSHTQNDMEAKLK